MSKAVLLLNLGTPSEPTAKGLREFYRYFFSDPFMFDFNPIGRWILRNLIILPFRAPRIAKDYEQIWLDDGSPLEVYAKQLQASVQKAFDGEGEDVVVANAMAYSKPFVWDAMAELESKGVREILLLPMFPQYSSATTESIFHQVEVAAAKWQDKPHLKFVSDLFQEQAFIHAWSDHIKKQLNTESVDHVIFSYHGVPEKTIKKSDRHNVCEFGQCCSEINESNRLCYRAQCVQTTENIVKALGWDAVDYSVAFQSRFGPLPWLQPYLDEHLKELIERGDKKVAVITPSFISDCLETLFEIGEEYKHEFMEGGGTAFQLVPNLNNQPVWFASVFEIAKSHLRKLVREEADKAA